MNDASHSHHDAAVRHSYPLAITSASFGTALNLLLKTLPYALVRFAILIALTVATIVWFVLTFGGYLLIATTKAAFFAYPWAIGWLVVGGYGYWAIARYFLYLLKAGHIAVLTELITKGAVGNGQEGMFAYGKNAVKERFGQVNALFALDAIVHGVVAAFNSTLDWVGSLIPVPGMSTITGVVNSIVRASTTYVDETIFSYNVARGDTNVWRSSRDGLVYYAQNAREVLKTGVWIVVLDKLLTVLAWVACLAPAFGLSLVLPTNVTLGGLLPMLFACLLASNIRAAFLKPLFLTMVMIKFHVEVAGQAIEPAWDARLSAVSEKFGKLKERAVGDGAAPAFATLGASPIANS